mmetsp:Transcript_34032/g.71650  ORF Transcript_34032/g.71650 Transcript_34032/m.71650 type:complete len:215 (+) Transcript_34032:216-860(+)
MSRKGDNIILPSMASDDNNNNINHRSRHDDIIVVLHHRRRRRRRHRRIARPLPPGNRLRAFLGGGGAQRSIRPGRNRARSRHCQIGWQEEEEEEEKKEEETTTIIGGRVGIATVDGSFRGGGTAYARRDDVRGGTRRRHRRGGLGRRTLLPRRRRGRTGDQIRIRGLPVQRRHVPGAVRRTRSAGMRAQDRDGVGTEVGGGVRIAVGDRRAGVR